MFTDNLSDNGLARIVHHREGIPVMHSTLHFAIGAGLATSALLPGTVNAIRNNAKSAGRIGFMILASYALGLLAVIPNLLRQIGLPEGVCTSPFMNFFLLHPLFDKIISGGMLIGELAIILFFALQYSLLLTAIKNIRKRK